MRRLGAFGATIALSVALLAPPAVAGARTSGTYHCRLSATKLGHRIEVTFRLRGSEIDRAWRVRLWDAGVKFADRTRATDAGGRIKVVATTRNRPGPDEIEGIARDQVAGARCEVELSV